jgi:metal-dependent amidase/aminoacylase/carboxypeptidase family protein
MKTSPRNITPFVLKELPPLHKLDQRMMRKLRRLADRTGCTVEYHIHEAIVQFVAEQKAERELENKIVSFAKR